MSKATIVLAVCIAATTACERASAASTYYVSPSGSDAADGLTPATAWASTAKVSSTSFAPGSSILFERGGEWRGKISATSSGTLAEPITYGAYGAGAKPIIYGSDVLDKNAFTLTGGTTYELPSAAPIGSLLANGQFLTSAWLAGNRSNNSALHRSYVDAHPGSYFYDDAADKLYVNLGDAPATDARQLTAVTRDDLVYSNFQSNLVFRDLVTDESAVYNAGYGFKAQNGSNIQFIDCEAYRAGKHHFGAINTTDFLGQGLKAQYALPDQGIGGATALVSYADQNFPGQVTAWRDVEIRDMNGLYPGWLSHGEGVGQITLDDIRSYGAELTIGANTVATNLYVEGAGIDVGGAIVDRAKLVGANANVRLWGSAQVSNLVIDGFHRVTSAAAPIVVRGTSNIIASSTITTNASDGQVDQLISYPTSDGSVALVGNIFANLAGGEPNLSIFPGITAANFQGDYNVYQNIRLRLGYSGPAMTLAQWQAKTGADLHSLIANPQFVDPLNADFHLSPASPAINLMPVAYLIGAGKHDFDGLDRDNTPFTDAGALDSLNIEQPLGADVDGNLRVDGADFLVWQRMGGDSAVLAAWKAELGIDRNASGPIAAPEPGAITLVVCAFLPATRPLGGRGSRRAA